MLKTVLRLIAAANTIGKIMNGGFSIEGYEPGNPQGISMDAFGSSEPRSALFACISILTGIFARLDHEIGMVDSDGQFKLDRDMPLNELMKRPDDVMTGHQLRERIYWDVFQHGNGVAKIIRNSMGDPIQLRYCKLSGPGVVQDGISRRKKYVVVFPTPGRMGVTENVDERDLLHLRWWGYSPFSGVSPSPIETHVMQTNALYQSSVRHQLQTLNKGFSARNVIENSIEQDPEMLIKFRTEIEELYSGNMKAGKTPILFPGMKMQTVGWSSVDLQLLEILKYAVTDLSRAYGIPLFILQADERTAGWSANSLPDRWLNFERITISSNGTRFADEWGNKLLPERMKDRRYLIRINPDSLTSSNLSQRSQTAKMIFTSGVATKNEARKVLGIAANA